MKLSLLPIAAAVAVATSAYAEETTTLPEVVVSASRTEQTVDNALASVTVISREEIARNPALDIGDLLSSYGGVNVVRSGGPGQQTSIFLRGAASTQVLVLVDGARIGTSSLGQPNIQFLRPDNIERIEIVRGPKSSLYGSEAIGGVINIITRKSSTPATTISVTGGGQGTFGGSLRQDSQSGKFSSAVAVSTFYTDGYPLLETVSEDSGYRNTGLLAQLGYGDSTLGANANYQQNSGRNEYLASFTLSPTSQDFFNDFTSLDVHGKFFEIWNSKLMYSMSREKNEQNGSSDYLHTEREQIDWQNDFALPGNNLVTAGATYYTNHVDTVSFGSGYDITLNTTAFYLQDQFTLGAFSALLAGRHESSSEYGNNSTGEATLGWSFSENYRAYATYSTGFKAPTAGDLYAPGFSNPDLKPEEAVNKEIGFKGQAGAWNFGLAAFRNDVDELINYNGMMPVNIDEARLSGGEFRLALRQGNLKWTNEYAYVKAEDRKTGDELSRRPRSSLSSQLDYSLDRYNVGGQIIARSDSDNSAYDNVEVPGWGVGNLYVGMEVSKQVSLTLNVQNIADKTYGTAYTGNQPYIAQPRLVTLTADIKL
ncbi:MAG TPA: TonB-dependent receptor [Moraxellaceae bacterium]